MGKAIEVISGYVTAPDTTLTAWSMAAGDSLRIRDFHSGSKAWLMSLWGQNQADGYLGVRGPRMHDNVQGLRAFIEAAYARTVIKPNMLQSLFPSEYLIVEQSGSAVAGDIEQGSFLVYYEDLPGADANLITYDELARRSVNLLMVKQALTCGTDGGYSGEQAINADYDPFKADTYYALLGAYASENQCTIGVRGIDTSNLRVGIPGPNINDVDGSDWFPYLARMTGKPCIPVINGSNKDATYCDVTNDEDASSPIVELVFAELE